VDVYVVHHSPKIEAYERALDLALLAIIGGSWPPVTLVIVRRWIIDDIDIPGDSFHVKRYYPEDFIIMLTYIDDMLRVLHDAVTLTFCESKFSRSSSALGCISK
jgi:hypothetical protein